MSFRGTIRWCWRAIRRQSPASKAGSCGSTPSPKTPDGQLHDAPQPRTRCSAIFLEKQYLVKRRARVLIKLTRTVHILYRNTFFIEMEETRAAGPARARFCRGGFHAHMAVAAATALHHLHARGADRRGTGA